MAALLEGGALSCAPSHRAQSSWTHGAAPRRQAHEAAQCSVRPTPGPLSCSQGSERQPQRRSSPLCQAGATGRGACRAEGAAPSGKLSRTPLTRPHLPVPRPFSPLSLPLSPSLSRSPSSQRPPSASADPAADATSEADVADDDWEDETFETQRPFERPASSLGISELDLNRWRQRPVEDKYRILVERAVSQDRMQELGVYHWSTWSSPGPCSYFWEWRADEQVFITQGTLTVTPYGCDQSAVFRAGDCVRFPKWLFAELEVSGSFEQRYRFRAYGDDN